MCTRIHVVAGDAQTSGRLAAALRAAGHQVSTSVGKEDDLFTGIQAAAPEVVLLAPAADDPDGGATLADDIRTRLGLPIVWYGTAGRSAAPLPPGSLHPFAVVPEAADPQAVGPALEGALRALALARRVAQAEQSLRESEQRQHAILDHIPDPAWLKDREGRYLAANRAWREFFGVEPGAFTGRTDREFLPAGVAEKFTEEDRYLVETGATTRIESEAVDAEGNLRWFETVKAPVHDAAGRLTGIVGIARDITRRQQMEDALRSTNNRFLAVWEQSVDGMRLTDAEGRIIAVNEAYCRLVGRTRAQLEGRLFPVVYDTSDPQADTLRLQRYRERFARREVPARQERRLRFAAGRVLDVDLSNSFLDLGGGQTALLAVFRDVTYRKHTEDALRLRAQGEGLLAQITARFINLPVAEIDGGLDTGLREIGALFEVDRAYLIPHDPLTPATGQSHEWCAPGVPPPGRRGPEFRGAADGGWDARLRALELVVVNHPGELPADSPARACLAQLGIQSLLLLPIAIRGRLMGVLGLEQTTGPREWSAEVVALTRLFAQVIANALERKRLEQDRERLLAELNRKHAELEHLVYVTSHDLRTPMLNIQGFAMRLEESCRELDRLTAAAALPPAERQTLQTLVTDRMPGAVNYVLASIEKMDRLIEALLRLSRLGRAELQAGRIDVDALVTGILDTVAFRLQETGADVEVRPLPACHGDTGQIGQLFSNLIDNAIKYRDPQRPLRITLEGRVEDGFVVYRVADNGLGIAPEHREKIWQVFFRVNPRGSVAGDGIGLNLVRRIAERHGGEVAVESTPGLGSCFQVRLPVAPLPATGPGPAPGPSAPAPS
jgi:PAS domain S-box-containing protein